MPVEGPNQTDPIDPLRSPLRVLRILIIGQKHGPSGLLIYCLMAVSDDDGAALHSVSESNEKG